MKSYTLTEIARILKVPESTARYHRDKFSDYLACTGEGRSRRYLPQSLDALKIIKDMLQQNNSNEEIESVLAARFGITIERDEPQQQTAITQQQPLDIAPILDFMAQQAAEIAELRKEIAGFHAKLDTRENERDEKLMQAIRGIQELQKPWYRKLFGAKQE